MKYLEFPAVGGEESVTICEECFEPNIRFVLSVNGITPGDTFGEMVEQLDALQETAGYPDPHRPNITDETPDLVCEKCSRQGEAAAS